MMEQIENGTCSSSTQKKNPKRGIIYLSTIPPYMNVTKIREIFNEYGTLGRVYLQLAETGKTVYKIHICQYKINTLL